MGKTIPYGGGSDYSALVKEGYAYVDKTMFIEKLERDPRLLSFFRPRRFGKSLFLSTLEYYYDYKYADDFDILFRNTYIGSNPTPRKNSFAVLKLNFSGINTTNQESLESSFSDAIAESIALFIEENQISLNNPIDYGKSSAIMINQFFKRASKKFKYPLYLIIDEYDHYANEILASNTNVFKSVMSAGGFIRTFFEVIKDAADSNIVSRLFMTGVSPISLDSLTSGFNITNNISLNDNYHDMAGFTKDEVNWLVNESLSNSKLNKDAIIKELEISYDGYKFSPYTSSKLFNSSMALYYLFQCASLVRPPRDFLDPNILSDYKKMQSIATIDLGKTEDASHEQREKLKADRLKAILSISSGQKYAIVLTQVFELFAMTTDNFISLLFYLGYLTIHSAKGKKTVLAIPNAVIKDIFIDYFNDIAPSMGMNVVEAEKAML
jgi:hypothetical protein